MATANPTADTMPTTSHPIGFWFFFWGEFAERCSYYGMRAILTLYMIDQLGISKTNAGTYMSLFMAACYFFPLAGGWVADNVLGKYWTIVLFSVPYVVGQFIVGIENPYVVAGALTLLAMGSGVIKPNISTLMGLTYDQQRHGQTQLRTSAFSYFYMAINIGAFLSQISMPLLRSKYGYQVAFLFPAVLMAIALTVFALGKKFYAKESIKRRVSEGTPVPAEGRTVTGLPVTYEVMTPETIAAEKAQKLEILSRIGALFATITVFWAIFDQSASTWIFFADTYMNCDLFGMPVPADFIQSFNALFIILLVPVSVAIFKAYPIKATTKILYGFLLTALAMAVMALPGYLAGERSKQLKVTTPEGSVIMPLAPGDQNEDGDLPLPPEADKGKKPVTLTVGAVTAEQLVVNPKTNKYEFAAGRVGDLVIENGHIVGTPPEAVQGSLETLLVKGDELAEVREAAAKATKPATATVEAVDWVKPAERVTVWWQILAFLVITVAEILVSITGLELAFVAAPQSMKSFVTGLWLLTVGIANLAINAPITRLYTKMPPYSYFAMLGGGMLAVTVIYVFIAARFNRTMEAVRAAEERAKSVEGNTKVI